MASQTHEIPLFGEKTLRQLDSCKSYFLLKIILLPYVTWFDHALLKHLVSVSKSDAAIKLLKEFESSIDYTQPITSYPIATPSQLIIPLAASDYTVVATKYTQYGEDTKLEEVKRIKLVLIKVWQITECSIQLIAVNQSLFCLYWLIPKCLVPLIEEQNLIDATQHELLEEGIIMTTFFPKEIFTADNALTLPALATGPFNFLCLFMHKNDMVRCLQMCNSMCSKSKTLKTKSQ